MRTPSRRVRQQGQITRNATIVSLALINANRAGYERDYLDCFMPFVGEALHSLSSEVVAESDLKNRIHEMFGLELPQSAVRALLRRARQADLVVLEHRVYRPNRQKLGASQFSEKQSYVLQCHARSLENLAAFCRERFGVEVRTSDAEAALQAFTRDNQFS